MTQEIVLTIKKNENIGEVDFEQTIRIQEILTALIESGGLTGVKNGKTVIHFNQEGHFMGVELAYWPWKRRKK